MVGDDGLGWLLSVRAPRSLRERAAANAQVARMNELDRVVAHHFGTESVDIVDVVENHELADQIGFQPNA